MLKTYIFGMDDLGYRGVVLARPQFAYIFGMDDLGYRGVVLARPQFAGLDR